MWLSQAIFRCDDGNTYGRFMGKDVYLWLIHLHSSICQIILKIYHSYEHMIISQVFVAFILSYAYLNPNLGGEYNEWLIVTLNIQNFVLGHIMVLFIHYNFNVQGLKMDRVALLFEGKSCGKKEQASWKIVEPSWIDVWSLTLPPIMICLYMYLIVCPNFICNLDLHC